VVLYGKILGGIFRFFSQKPYQIEEFFGEGGRQIPQPPSGYAPGAAVHRLPHHCSRNNQLVSSK